ncbi:T9SS type A sorting domain-containing protein [Rhodocytophaga rosea]|uniref:T9SS type A sorting domain-containing protein n=1 Tax=Rhodocytophaga rosea TaxID=2704465 RepID=A0A6C0GQX4_9BACT|nr:T9SS type A sorting domain-containing protein [Rhodocytophaga rosea]QHT70013.1 T9SS type A sorting domain-containing protein [Rhodocytophaga rosea]
MKKLRILILLGIVCLAAIPTMAQKLVPYTFRFEHQADTLKELELKVLTQVTYASTASLRLYFKGTQLGDNSYLLLEGTDGAKQELRKQDLENWQYSSAYFNGNAVKVSLIETAGEKNRVHISEIKVSKEQTDPDQADQKNTARISSETFQAATQAAPASTSYPYAAAVGRFTNGIKSFGTGWIAPNGAIITSYDIYWGYVSKSYDIIEFNVPPSNGTTVMHPGPEDQYPMVKHTNKYSNISPSFKGTSGDDNFIGGFAVLEALPNSTGLRPGERQKQYFRIATNPGSFVTSSDGIPVDIFQYGMPLRVSGSGQISALQLEATTLLPQSTHLKSYTGVTQYDREWFVLYQAPDIQEISVDEVIGSDAGGPITYQSSNVAIGIHNKNVPEFPAYGIGFSMSAFRNNLNDFFSANSVYVDGEGLYDPEDATGEIHKPYPTLYQAANEVSDGTQLYIAKGTYYAPLTINRPMTLRAPVGKVILGAPNPNARTAAGPSIPKELLMESAGFDDLEEELASVNSFVSYPNPFQDQTTIEYHLPDKSHVSVRVFNSTGAEMAILTNGVKEAGIHTIEWNGKDIQGREVPAGMYILQLIKGGKISVYKLIKK